MKFPYSIPSMGTFGCASCQEALKGGEWGLSHNTFVITTYLSGMDNMFMQ